MQFDFMAEIMKKLYVSIKDNVMLSDIYFVFWCNMLSQNTSIIRKTRGVVDFPCHLRILSYFCTKNSSCYIRILCYCCSQKVGITTDICFASCLSTLKPTWRRSLQVIQMLRHMQMLTQDQRWTCQLLLYELSPLSIRLRLTKY